ncbi:argininosuccinate synthase [Thermoplasma sp.]|uniref:argininosuccinate synthase n=1 Tax=Thermoplasma sp. TaxID=1973142 RepID=UPI001285BB29|nr:argininosuccinate synthase [Thermoplasma sp.]KAA8921954.1 MAG: argininosuccinate synthase [Thermoplasma sp.]
MDKALLLYSGGLDTSVMIKWLQENLSLAVSTLTLNVGNSDLVAIQEKARTLGADPVFVHDAIDEFAQGFIAKSIMANGSYEGYPLSTALARPLMAEKAVEYAHRIGAKYVVHGSTGRGNDQVRFEVSIRAIDPSIQVLAPVREWNMMRKDEIDYAKKHGIPVKLDGKYSIDENIWGRSIEGPDIEDIGKGIPEDVYEWVTPPWQAKNDHIVKISFDGGIPTEIDGEKMKLSDIITYLNAVAGSSGIGLIDHMENRVVGLKSHEVYECPAATVITYAHRYLESLILNRNETEMKMFMDWQFSKFVYGGLWHDPVMNAINAAEAEFNRDINGELKIRMSHGLMYTEGAWGNSFLYSTDLINYSSNAFDQRSSKGFIDIYGNATIHSHKRALKMTGKVEGTSLQY